MSINYATLQNTVFPTATTLPQTLRKSSDGILEAYGLAVPADGVGGYVPGCLFIAVNGVGRNNVLFINEGTATSCDFNTIRYLPDHYGTTTGRGPSPAIWDDCPVLEYVANPEKGMHYFEDFIGDIYGVTNTTTYQNRLTFFNDDGPTHQNIATDKYGALQVIGNDADNDDSAMAFGQFCGPFVLTAGKKFWFEARVRKDAVDNDFLGMFIGFAEQGLCAADSLDVATAECLTAKDWLGFLNKLDDGNAIDFVHGDGAGEVVEKKAGICVPTAGAWNKLGLYGDGTTVTPYVDGVPTTDTVLYSAADMPLGEEMGLYWLLKNGDAAPAEHKGSIDWWRLAVEY